MQALTKLHLEALAGNQWLPANKIIILFYLEIENIPLFLSDSAEDHEHSA